MKFFKKVVIFYFGHDGTLESTELVFQNLDGRKVVSILIQVGVKQSTSMPPSCPGWACTYINQLITTSNRDSGHYSRGKSKKVCWEKTYIVFRYILARIGRSQGVVGKRSNKHLYRYYLTYSA